MTIQRDRLRDDLEGGFVWMDYMSIPQAQPVLQKRAIDSINDYVQRVDYFVVLAGPWTHENGSVRDVRAWADRG